jgi:YD repeat-containing protein
LLTSTLYQQPDPDGAGAAQPSGPQTTRYVYDGGNRNLLRFTVTAMGRVTEYRYDSYGQQVAALTYRCAAYPVSSLAAAAPLSESELVTWSSTQDLSTVLLVDTEFDVRGQVKTRTSYASVSASGVGVRDGTQSVQSYLYDQRGNLLQTVSPPNGTTTFVYDGLGRLTASTDALNQLTVTQYDDARGKVAVTVANGLVTTSAYDAAGRLVSVLKSVGVSPLGQTNYYYDASGRLRMTQDPTGVRQWMFYDAASRKSAEVDGNGTMTAYSYDAAGLLTCTVTYAAAVNVTALVDAGGQPLVNLSADSIRPATSIGDVREWRDYDASGRLSRVARSVGIADGMAVNEYSYYGASRLVKVL